MMVMDPLDGWKTQAEAAEILKCSQKTIGRMAAQKKIQRVMRRIPRSLSGLPGPNRVSR